MSSHPLARLGALGQSPWYDFITRDLLASGALAALIKDEGLRGMTSNPTIFEKAIAGSSDYDADIATLASQGKSVDEIVEALMVKDVQVACDIFLPTYEEHRNGDGTVSLEVPPTLAHDTEGTIAAAERLWASVDRPNAMIKVPGTREGLPAISHLLSQGINVNVTLLFSIERYHQVIDAFLEGLERRVTAGKGIAELHSVASFFVSRLDGKTDPAIRAAGDAAAPLLGKIAIANAIGAYEAFSASLLTPRWQALAGHGASPQRPLWASTSTKDPSLPDTYYVEALIAPDTVNTIPPDTFRAYADHGDPHVRITPDAEAEARATIEKYHARGLPSLKELTDFLERDGVEKFTASWHSLLDAVSAKAGVPRA